MSIDTTEDRIKAVINNENTDPDAGAVLKKWKVGNKQEVGVIIDKGLEGVTYSYGEFVSFNKDAQSDIKAALIAIHNFEKCGNPDKLTKEQVAALYDYVKGLVTALKTLVGSLFPNSGEISSRSFSDYDIRELMKMLIQAFSQLMTSQRQSDLNTINGIIQALETKIASMEQSRDAYYKASIVTAVGSLITGALQIAGAAAQLAKTGKALKTKNEAKVGTTQTATQSKPTDKTIPEAASQSNSTDDPYLGIRELFAEESPTPQAGTKVEISPDMLQKEMNDGRAISDILNGAGGVSNAIAALISAGYTSEAKTTEIETAKTDALLEVLRKAQENGSSALRQLLEFISKLLSTMQELQQNVASTERTIVA